MLRRVLGFTLIRLCGAFWTVFTRPAITPPKVNRFGWNLKSCQPNVGGWPWQTLGAIHAVASSHSLTGSQKMFVFCQVNNARFHRFPSDNFHEFCTQQHRSVSRCKLSEQNFENFIIRGRFSKKAKMSRKCSNSGDFRPPELRNDNRSPHTHRHGQNKSLRHLDPFSRFAELSRTWPTDRQTDRPRYYICSNKPLSLAIAAMWPNNNNNNNNKLSP